MLNWIRKVIKGFLFPIKPLRYYLIDKTMPELVFNPKNFGIDLYARHSVMIQPHNDKPTLVPLNVVIEGERDRVALIFPRSSLPGKTGTILGNSVGVIDVEYSGYNPETDKYDELMACLINYTDKPVEIEKGQRICQLLFLNRCEISETHLCLNHWGNKTRGGFGSSGKF